MSADSHAPRSVPASLAQRALWLLGKTLSDQAVYNEPNVYRLKGRLDLEALAKAINEVVRRHESLRTRFHAEGSEVLQLIESELAIPVPVTDLRAVPASARDTEARSRASDEARASFDLEEGPLIRVRLLRTADEEHWLLITRHHIVRDGTSDIVFAQELSALYAAYRSGESSPLAEPRAQFSEHALRQREQLESEGFAEQLAYWRKALGELSVLELPLDRPRPARPSHRGARVSVAIDQRLTRALRELAHAEGTTLFTTLLASLQVLLFRYSGQDDIAIGVAVSGRPPGFEGAVGYFTNLVVVRGDLAGAPTFRQQLARTADRAREAYRHQDVPFATLVENLAPRRDPSRNPLFQVSLVKATDPGEKPELAGLEVEPVETGGTGTVKFDLDFSVAEEQGTVVLGVEYSTDLFRASTVEGMVEQWRRLLESIVDRPDERISRLRLLDDASRRRALVEWNATRRAYPAEASIAATFAEQAQRTPGAIALTDGGRTLDYAALSRRSRALAHRLRTAGAAPGRRVAVCIERSLEEVVALLAVLHAGCAYVPLDPAHPPERIASLLADADAAAVLAVEASAPAIAAGTGDRPLLFVDDPGVDDVLDAPAASGGGDAAYVIYTSGTTGSPKGVVIPHRGVLRLVRGSDYVRLGADDVVAHLSNPAFDAATFEVWGALLNGARLAVIPRDAALSPATLASVLDRENVTTLFVTTALFHRIAQDAPHALAGRQVLFGGEAAEPRWVARALREGRPRRLLHVYGPTETTTFATWHEVRDVEEDALTVPIGRPIANTEVYLLDGELEPVPPGVPGELWIGGPGLALGYLNDPNLTSERFTAHPVSAEPGARLYRTGDRARYREDGSIEFLGRLDDQVKIRGFRIEPREIEAALSRLPDVRQALVLLHGSTSDTRRLSAYVVPKPGAAPTPADLWRELRRTLPEYLVPHGLVILETLPLTPTGKIDRRALPDPLDLAQRTKPQSPPDTLIEFLLAEIWKRLLELRHVDVRESFFDLGGHSLLAAKMIEEIERVCGVRIPVTTLFTSATIAELAAVLRAGVPTPDPLVALNARGLRPPLFFLHGDFIEGGLYCRGLAAALGADQPFWAVHPHGLDRGALPASIEAMAADRVAAIQREHPRGPYFLGGHCNGALVAVEIARQLMEAGEQVPAVVVLDCAARNSYAELRTVASSDGESDRHGEARIARSGDRQVAAIDEHYRRAMQQYVPEPFPGRIAVLRSLKYRRADPDLGWAAFARQIETHRIPGGHLSSVTRHIATTAACISGCLDAAYGQGRA